MRRKIQKLKHINKASYKQFNTLTLICIFTLSLFIIPVVSFANDDINPVRVDIETNSMDSIIYDAPIVIGDKLLVGWADLTTGQYYHSIVDKAGNVVTNPINYVIDKKTDSTKVFKKLLANGYILVYWYNQSLNNILTTDCFFKIIDINGIEIVPTTKINSQQGELNRFTEVAQLSNGNLAFVWATDGSNYALRRFTTDGTPIDAKQISITSLVGIAGSQYTHKIAANENGRFMIMLKNYSSPNYIGMIFENNSQAPIQVGGQNMFTISSVGENGADGIHQLVALPNGKFLTAYRKKMGADTNTRSLALKIYNDDGSVHLDEKVIRTLHSWGEIEEPVVTEGGFYLFSSYIDLNSGTKNYYNEEYNIDGSLKGNLQIIDKQLNETYGAKFRFRDIDGKMSLLINDIEITGRTDYDTWILRNQTIQDSTINPSTSSFNKNVTKQADVVVEMELNGNSLTNISNNGTTLTKGTDYTLSGSTVTIKKEYLATLQAGTTTLNFIFSAGKSQSLVITIVDIPTYKILYNGNNHTSGNVPIDSNVYEQNTKVTVLGNTGALQRTGYTFEGWNTESNGSGISYSVGDTFSITSNVTLYAKWKVNEYTVTFKNPDGTVLKTETVQHGSNATAPENPTRIGHTFTGWDKGFTNITDDLTVTAQYQVNEYDIHFDSKGGSSVNSQKAEYGSKISAPVPPTKEGYNFAGWYKEENLTTAWNFATDTVPVNGITLYAKWTIKEYTVTFKNPDGTVLKTETVQHGSNATAPENPTRIGHTFTGWDKGFTNITDDLTVTAQYQVNEYDIHFDSKGGSSVNSQKAEYGSKISAPVSPTKEGYNFAGWYKEENLTTAWNFATDTVPVNGITLYAKWTIKEYTVTFKNPDGTVLKTETVQHGSNATAPENPTRIGHTFTGWDKGFTNITDDLTVTAQYQVNEYDIHFDSKGGSSVSSQKADYGSKISAPVPPTKEGYNFAGWYKEENLTTAWNFATDTVPVNGITLYAKWTIKEYTVTFKNPDGTVLKTETVQHGSNATAPENPTRIGHTFTGWDKGFTNITDDLTVTAQYQVNEYDIHFDSKGGSSVNSQKAEYGSKISAPVPPTKEGYNFAGWYKEENLTTAWNFATDTVPENGITLHAKWDIKKYTVTFNNHDGTEILTVTVEHGSNAIAPSNPTRIGYTFTGWDKDFTNVTSNITVTAQYSVNEYAITFSSNGGSTVASINANYGSLLTSLPQPTRTKYTFEGWYKDKELTRLWDLATDTVPVNGIELYAKWNISLELNNLTLSAGQLSPNFDSSILSYTANVGYGVTNITITPTLANDQATLTINGQNVLNDRATEPINLNVGSNVLTIEVTSVEGLTKTYTILINRAPSTNSGGYLPPPQSEPYPGETRVIPVLTGDQTQVDVEISRLIKDGKKVDAVSLDEKNLNQVIGQAIQSGQNYVKMMVTDLPNDPVQKVEVSIKKSFLKGLGDNNIELTIETENGEISIPTHTLTNNENKDILIEIEKVTDPTELGNTKNMISQLTSGGIPISTPLEIKTNYTGESKIALSLTNINFPSNPDELREFLNSLAVFIQHSDGEKKVEKGTIIYDSFGNPTGIAFVVNKFSIFTAIQIPENPDNNWDIRKAEYPVMPDKTWTISFSEPIDETSLHQNVYVEDQEGNRINVQINVTDASKLVVSPVTYYDPNKVYYLIINNLKSSFGKELSRPVKFEFEVANFSLSGQSKKTQVITDVHKQWIIKFNESLNELFITQDNVFIVDENGSKHEAVIQLSDNDTIIIQPIVPYDLSKAYYLFIQNIESTSGKRLNQNVWMKFFINEGEVVSKMLDISEENDFLKENVGDDELPNIDLIMELDN